MNKLLYVLSFVVMTLVGFSQNSQNKLNLSEGTRYMVAFPQVWASPSEKPLPQPMQLFISSKVKTKVRVQTPSSINDNARLDREYSVEPNKVLKVPISVNYMNTASQTKSGYGILVTSTRPISVSTYQAWMGNGELARHLPIDAWGTAYYTSNMYQDRYGQNGDYKYRPSQILIVSARDNTVVTYTSTWDTEGGNDNPGARKGQSQTITLDRGETYLIKGRIDENFNKEWSTDLSGTFIRSTKPFGVVSGHTKVAILRYPDVLPPIGMFQTEAHFVRNNVHDAQLPVEMAGTEFVTIPTMYTSVRANPIGTTGAEIGIEDDRGDVLRFVALEDGTRVFKMRQNGGGLTPERLINKGESFIVNVLQDPTFWKSDKPVLATQYGKSYAKVLPPAFGKDAGDKTQGHPTVEAGMPMMEYVPSVDRWTNYGVFSSPEGMDNFLNIVFKTTEVGKIKIDGRVLSSALGGTMRPLQGTPYSTIRASMGVGDHYIESTEPGVRWMAWTYGSLDGMQQGRAYGTPVSIDLSIPCDDSLDIEYEIACADLEGRVKILPENSECAKFFSFVIEDENNFKLEADIDELSESKVFPFKLVVIDRKKSAYAKIRVVTRSGNWIEKEFRYEGIDLTFEPNSIDFGTHPVLQTNARAICSTVVVTNKSQRPITINDLSFGNPTFTVSPRSITLGPNESKLLEVCANPKIENRQTDTLNVDVNCIKLKPLSVTVIGDQPLFYAGDQNWGSIPALDKQTKQVELLNAGKSDIIITEYQPRGNTYFTNSTLISSLPLTLKPGQRFKYDVDYSPNGEVAKTHSLRIDYTTNAKREKLYSELQGSGSDAQLSVQSFSWTERVIDQYQRLRKQWPGGNIEYTGSVKVQNLGNTVARIKSVSIVGQMSSVFDWRGDQTLNDDITPNGTRTIQVFFRPFETPQRGAERKYNSELVIEYVVNGETKEVRSNIEGTALQPMVQLTNQDWGMKQVNSITSLPITVANENVYASSPLLGNQAGTMDLLVDSLVIEDGNQPFVWSKTSEKVIRFNPPIAIAGLSKEEISVDFMPIMPGSFRSPYRLYANTLDTTFSTLEGTAPGENMIEPIHLITWIGTSTTGSVSGTSAYSTILKFKEFRGGDYLLFGPAPGQSLLPFQTEASVPFKFDMQFTPDKVTLGGLKPGQNLKARLPYQDQKFSTQIVFEDVNGNEIIGSITGDGKYLETTLRIVSQKSVDIGKTAKASFFLEPTPESIDSGNVESARLRLTFDNSVINPNKIDPLGFPKASILEEKKSSGMIEIDMVTVPQVDGFLGTKEFQTLLDSKNSTLLDGLYYTINKAGKIASPYIVINVIPDEVTVIPVCANARRVIEVGKPYGIIVKDNIVEVTVGIDAPLELSSVNEIGQQTVLFSGFVKKGTYTFPITTRGIQWIVARQIDWMETLSVVVH